MILLHTLSIQTLGGREHRILRALSQGIIGMGKIKVHWGPESQVMTWGKQPPGKHCKMWKEKVNAYLESIHPQDLWCTMLCNGLLGRGLFPLYLFSYLLSLNNDIQRSFKLNFINFFCHQKKKKLFQEAWLVSLGLEDHDLF